MFLEVYKESLTLHPTDEIQNEINFIELLYAKERDIRIERGNSSLSKTKIFPCELRKNSLKNKRFRKQEIRNSVENSNALPDWLIGDYWLYEGIRCNDLFLHSDAVVYLTAAIEKDPLNVEAHQERAHAHFEMGNLDLAIADYEKSKQITVKEKEITEIINQLGYVFGENENDQGGYVINPEPKGMMDFSGGFCVGISKGGSDSLVEFVPSTWSCCKGILHGVWCFACSPKEVSGDLINASYELVKFIRENTARECLEVVVPELKELCLNWDSLSDYDRGSQTGYIIGKYGLDVLAPGAALKGIKKYQQLKRLNSMFTIECCVASQAKKAKILEASHKHSSIRSTLTESVKMGKIISQNPNVAAHVMQKKHAWDRVIKLTGDTKEDFAQVVRFLEKNKILKGKKKNIGRFPVGSSTPKINRNRYKVEVKGQIVEADFVEYLETNEFFLNDAWVNTLD